VPAGEKGDETVHITDIFKTLVRAGLEFPRDRVIDGLDQRAFFEGKQKASSREGFP
jgi:arylsulfatase